MEIANPDSPAKQWNADNVLVQPEFSPNWGIKSEHMPLAMRILGDNKLVNPSGLLGNGLRFDQFQILVRFLYDKGYDSTDINNSLINFEKETRGKETPDNLFQQEMQQLLPTFYSRYAPIPAAANQQTTPDVLREAIARNYNIKENTLPDYLLNVLKAISKRIVRIHSSNNYVLKHITYNPFTIIDTAPQQWELIHKGNGVSLLNKEDAELVHFHSFFSLDKRGLPDFNQFAAWFMLLNMGSMQYKQVCRISVEQNKQWIPLEELPAESKETLLIQPDYFLSYDSFTLTQRIRFFSPTEEQIEIYGIYFSGDFEFAIAKGDSEQDPDTGQEVRVFDSEYFFRNYNYLKNTDDDAHSLRKADFLKIVVVKKEFPSNSATDETRKTSGVRDANAEFYRFITANESDIYAHYTIGLLFNEAKQPLPLNGKTILVAGSSKGKLSIKETIMSEALGRYLAQKGYKIISSGFKGVESTVALSFKKYLEEHGISDKERSTQFVDTIEEPALDYGTIEPTGRKSNWHEIGLERSDALITIGGSSGTGDVIKKAMDKFIPVIPIPATGGESKSVYLQLLNEDRVQNYELFASMDQKLNTPADADAILTVVDELLKQALMNRKAGLSKNAFVKMVKELYNNTTATTVIADDTQKNRWGGKAQRNGKTLSAIVEPIGKSRMCHLTLRVTGMHSGEWAAFFLHHYFPNEIEYAEAKDGVAEYKLQASEAFAIGAITSDGTRLELDLQQQPGYPETFYYSVPDKPFTDTVEQLLRDRKQTVSDDRQKNRWGSQPSAGGLLMKASVSQSKAGNGMFDVVVTIQSITTTILTGEVAFFLHESFLDEVMYVKVADGMATLELVAYEAFTLGAYTSSGTMLELDLQQQTGYPKSFYYKQ
jgi:hypothetical protein